MMFCFGEGVRWRISSPCRLAAIGPAYRHWLRPSSFFQGVYLELLARGGGVFLFNFFLIIACIFFLLYPMKLAQSCAGSFEEKKNCFYK